MDARSFRSKAAARDVVTGRSRGTIVLLPPQVHLQKDVGAVSRVSCWSLRSGGGGLTCSEGGREKSEKGDQEQQRIWLSVVHCEVWKVGAREGQVVESSQPPTVGVADEAWHGWH